MKWYERLEQAPWWIHQVYGKFNEGTGRCALGVVCQDDHSVGSTLTLDGIHRMELEDLPMEVSCAVAKCPRKFFSLGMLVMHLNDTHRFTFQEIANVIKPLEQEHREDPTEDEDRELVYAKERDSDVQEPTQCPY